ncbi:esterase FE4-like [Planococcus citri]|uniref:esterase FE4-like n=1 Tax=Planococcus citri TaxID=170843 RepID=UPI0031F93E72
MSEKVTVTVKEGKVRGIKKKSTFSNTEYYSFFGVPYGQSTAGTFRYKDPVPIKPWKNILDATIEKKSGCLQFSVHHKCICGSEDCLYNNIHTPTIPSKGDPLKAVIVNIHPGGLVHGSPETWYYGSPELIMHLDIVYVSVAHRLHFLGFLNLDLEECSGNQGLKDIIMGLRWIKNNISAFGGDPNNVTLLGSSNGAVTIHHIMLSPLAKGLFHKAVMMGGYAFNPLRIFTEENATLSSQIAQDLGYEVTDKRDKKKLLSIYRKLAVETIVQFRPDRSINQYLGTPFPCSPFMPTIDPGENGALPKHHKELIDTTARVPILFGICENEAALGFCRGMREGTLNHFFTSIRYNYFGWGYDLTNDEIQFIKEQIEAFYWKGKPIEAAPLPLKIDIHTDMAYSDAYNTLINVIAADLPSSVYVYKFTFEGNACTLKDKLMGLFDEPIEGTLHGDDFCYWAKITNRWDIHDRPWTSETSKMINTFTKIIGNFSKTGNPNCEDLGTNWNPSTIEKPCYMKIDRKMELIDGKLNGERMEFWENLKKKLKRE